MNRPTTLLLVLAALLVAACRRSDTNTPPASNSAAPSSAALAPSPFTADYLHFEPVGAPLAGRPWIAQVAALDLDRDGLVDLLACDSQKNQVLWLRQTTRGHFEESILAAEIGGPVHIDAADLDGDGDLDLLIASMGQVFPTNDRIGSIVVLENDGHQNFTPHVLVDHVARVTDVRAGDFNHDGRLDLAVAQFGYDQGEIRWMENLGGWQFRAHNLLNLSGAINILIADFDASGSPDIAAIVSQQWEEIHLFTNDGAGHFTDRVVYGSTNEDFGSSGISLCDLNRDGRPDILYTNGDGFDYAEPGARPWHGVQWLENRGQGTFKYHRIGDLPGAYSPVGVDLDGDGATDVVAVSGFNDWKNPASASLVVFQNDGRENFTPHVLAHTPTHLMTLAVGDLDGTGRPILVTGGFHAYPPWENMSRLGVWRCSSVKP